MLGFKSPSRAGVEVVREDTDVLYKVRPVCRQPALRMTRAADPCAWPLLRCPTPEPATTPWWRQHPGLCTCWAPRPSRGLHALHLWPPCSASPLHPCAAHSCPAAPFTHSHAMQRVREKVRQHKDRQYHYVHEMRLAMHRGDRDLSRMLEQRVGALNSGLGSL